MDTSRAYEEMCSKATEVQEILKELNAHLMEGHFERPLKWTIIDRTTMPATQKIIFLPRQDSLQSIMMTGNTTATELVNGLAIRAKGADYLFYEWNWSMEQLWLAYVMKEKFGKVWSIYKKEWLPANLKSVYCKNCETHFSEEELVDNDGKGSRCPKCLRNDYLADC